MARMQRLPTGVVPVAAPVCGAACHVCAVEDEAEDNVMLQVIVIEQDRDCSVVFSQSDGCFPGGKVNSSWSVAQEDLRRSGGLINSVRSLQLCFKSLWTKRT